VYGYICIICGNYSFTVEKDTDHVGAVEKDAGNLTNLNGAMVWNGKNG
jgi:hypothetical protein